MASYTAVSAKVLALYGRRLTPEDYRQLLSKKTIAEAAAFLKSHPGYGPGLAAPSSGELHRETLESALRSIYVDEYRRIFLFMQLSDKDLLRFPIYRAEQSAILTTMHHLTSTHILAPVTTWAPILEKQSRLDLSGLQNAASFEDIAKAAQDTIYGSALHRISSGDSHAPTQAFVDNMMQVAYYARLYKILARNYRGETKADREAGAGR